MARYIGPKAKIARKYKINLFGNPKIDKILSKRPFPPGQHGPTLRKKLSEYGMQLAEKQKAKYFYNVSEKQFKKYFEKANKMKGNTADNLIALLERRIDIVVYRSGLAPTIAAARQLVKHGHFLFNGKKNDIPSALLKINDVIDIKPKTKEKQLEIIENTLKDAGSFPEWLEVNKATQSAKLVGQPISEEAVPFINVNLIVELYSK